MTRKDHLVQLVAGLISDPNRSDSIAGHVSEAALFLAEIEKELGEVRDASGRSRTVGQQQIDAEVAKAVAVERERCAIVADGFMTSVGDAIAHRIRSGK